MKKEQTVTEKLLALPTIEKAKILHRMKQNRAKRLKNEELLRQIEEMENPNQAYLKSIEKRGQEDLKAREELSNQQISSQELEEQVAEIWAVHGKPNPNKKMKKEHTIQERYEAIPQIEKAKRMFLMKKNRAKRLKQENSEKAIKQIKEWKNSPTDLKDAIQRMKINSKDTN